MGGGVRCDPISDWLVGSRTYATSAFVPVRRGKCFVIGLPCPDAWPLMNAKSKGVWADRSVVTHLRGHASPLYGRGGEALSDKSPRLSVAAQVAFPMVDSLNFTADRLARRQRAWPCLAAASPSTARCSGAPEAFDVVRPRDEEVDEFHRIISA